MTPSYSAMDWLLICSVRDIRNNVPRAFIFKCIYAYCYVFVQCPRFTSACGSWK